MGVWDVLESLWRMWRQTLLRSCLVMDALHGCPLSMGTGWREKWRRKKGGIKCCRRKVAAPCTTYVFRRDGAAVEISESEQLYRYGANLTVFHALFFPNFYFLPHLSSLANFCSQTLRIPRSPYAVQRLFPLFAFAPSAFPSLVQTSHRLHASPVESMPHNSLHFPAGSVYLD